MTSLLQGRPTWRAAALEGALYAALTLVITWPLAAHPTTSLPGDFGDPLFVTSVLGWVMRQLTAVLTGRGEEIAGLWDAPFFFPERNTLALSEHFIPQAVQALPVWWLTGNLLVAYTFVTLLSFVLLAFGTSRLVRELTACRAAGIAAGVMAAFNPYRLLLEISHLHVLSIQWLPFALIGLHGFVRSGRQGSSTGRWHRVRYLAFGAFSVIALNLSSGYYLLYAAPFIALFVLADLYISDALRDRDTWIRLAAAALAVGLATFPFVLPYIAMQRHQGFERTLQEVVAFSATLDQYEAALPWLGLMVVCACGVVLARAGSSQARDTDRIAPVEPTRCAGTNGSHVLGYALVLAVIAALAFWLSLGPLVRLGGQPVDVPSAYQVLYDWVPGFHGLRVASRYAAIVLVCLTVLAGMGLGTFARWAPRAGAAGIPVVVVLFLSLIWPARFPVNDSRPPAGLQPPPAYLTPSSRLPAIYAAVAALPPDAVLVELPFGNDWYELRYMYFGAMHGRRLTNGYSGVYPASYATRRERLSNPMASPARAAMGLAGATHAIVHTRAWTDDTGPRLEAWLMSLGAVPLAEADGARLFALGTLRGFPGHAP